MSTTTTLPRQLQPVARWFLGLSLSQVLRTISWGTATALLLVWWTSAGSGLEKHLEPITPTSQERGRRASS